MFCVKNAFLVDIFGVEMHLSEWLVLDGEAVYNRPTSGICTKTEGAERI